MNGVMNQTALACPACRGGLIPTDDALACPRCDRRFGHVAGIPDLRIKSDRYLDLHSERAKAGRLAAFEPTTDLSGLAAAYYDMTDDVVDWRRGRFLDHIGRAVGRGQALVDRLPEFGSVLEVGCGTGGFLVAAAEQGRELTGVDIASRWLVVARRRLTDHGLSVPLLAAEAERLPWPDGSFDAVVADSVLEHLDDPAAALREWRRVVRPGGTLVVWSPNRFSLATDPHLGLWGLGWAPRGALPAYLRFRGKSEWPPRTMSAGEARRTAASAGWGAVRVEAPAMTRAWASSRPAGEQRALRGYEALRKQRPGRAFLRKFGPLWELRALAGDAG